MLRLQLRGCEYRVSAENVGEARRPERELCEPHLRMRLKRKLYLEAETAIFFMHRRIGSISAVIIV